MTGGIGESKKIKISLPYVLQNSKKIGTDWAQLIQFESLALFTFGLCACFKMIFEFMFQLILP